MPAHRRGASLTEVLVSIAIAALLLGLVLGAIQKVRGRAARLRDESNVRQVGLAAHGYQGQHGRLPPLIAGAGMPAGYHEYSVPVAALLLTHLEQPPAATLLLPQPGGGPLYFHHVVPAYVSASDPSHADGRVVWSEDVRPGVGNVAFNVQALGPRFGPCGDVDGKASLTGSFHDGTSNTFLLATKRGKCGPAGANRVSGGSWWISLVFRGHCPSGPAPEATTAAMFGHVLPDDTGSGPTFQDRPGQDECDPELAQGFHAGGVIVGFADGSARTVRSGVDPKLWRAGLLPADGAGFAGD